MVRVMQAPGGVPNVGWEVIPPKASGPLWFVRTLPEALGAIPRHRARYDHPKVGGR